METEKKLWEGFKDQGYLERREVVSKSAMVARFKEAVDADVEREMKHFNKGRWDAYFAKQAVKSFMMRHKNEIKSVGADYNEINAYLLKVLGLL